MSYIFTEVRAGPGGCASTLPLPLEHEPAILRPDLTHRPRPTVAILEPSFVPILTSQSATRGLSALVLALASLAAPPVLSATPNAAEVLEPADSLEGNFLSAYIAGASRDTSAATAFFREA